MPAVAMTPTVSAKGVSREDVDSLAGVLANLEDGQFASTGETFDNRAAANAIASKFIRVMESRFSGLHLRSRTWELPEGGWVFGLREKEAKPEAVVPESPSTPSATAPRGRSGRRSR